jgi:hypothetical protein
LEATLSTIYTALAQAAPDASVLDTTKAWVAQGVLGSVAALFLVGVIIMFKLLTSERKLHTAELASDRKAHDEQIERMVKEHAERTTKLIAEYQVKLDAWEARYSTKTESFNAKWAEHALSLSAMIEAQKRRGG